MPANRNAASSESSSETVTVTVNSRTVEGVFLYRSRYDFEVQIQQPFPPLPPLHTGWHIPVYSRHRRDFMTEYGDLRARETLLDLYGLCRFLEDNRAALVQTFAALQEQIGQITDPDVDDDEAYQAKRLKLRAQLRAGQHDGREHQRLMREIGKRREAYEQQKRALIDQFFEGHIPLACSIDLREQVSELLAAWHQTQE